MNGEIAVGFFRHGTEVPIVRHEDAPPVRWDAVSVRSTADGRDRWRPVSALDDTDAATLVRSADPIDVGATAGSADRTIRPYLFECDTRELSLFSDGSFAAHAWVQPPALLDRETAPGLWEAYLAVAPSIPTVREDTDHGASYVSLRALETLRDRAAAAAATGEGYDSVATTARELCRARPSMGVVRTRIDRVMAEADSDPGSVRDRAMKACAAAVRADEAAAERAASRLGDRVFTLSRSGTVRSALEAAGPDAVFVAESRPAREGVGVAERLAETEAETETETGNETGTDVTLLVDAAIEGLLADGTVDTVLVGADTVLEDGSVINKVGSRTAMRAGTAAGIDCYAVCSRDKIVPGTEFDPEFGPAAAVYGGEADLAVYNPTFERVPPPAVSGIVTEDGVYGPDEIGPIAREHALYRGWDG